MTPEAPETPGRLAGVQPRPRALLFCSEDDRDLVAKLEALFPTSRTVRRPSEVVEEEYDVLVSTKGVTAEVDAPFGGRMRVPFSGHLYVIAFGGDDLGNAAEGVGGEFRIRRSPHGPPATLFQIPPGLPERVEELVERDLVPRAQGAERVNHIDTGGRYSAAANLEPFLTTSTGVPIAGSFRREGGGELWSLPPDVRLHTEWVRAALRHWQQLEPTRFQDIPGWDEKRCWLTARERALHDDLHETEAELTATLQRLKARREELRQELLEARDEANGSRRRLLTAKDDDLAHEVAACLQRFGFEVADMDSVRGNGPKREDLQVTDDDGWQALVEVKGHRRGGAKANDLLKVLKHQSMYVQENGRFPNATWFVVNQFAGQDPVLREPVLASDPSALQDFADAGGVAIDTTSLFLLVADVEAGKVAEADARRLMREAVSRFEYAYPSDT